MVNIHIIALPDSYDSALYGIKDILEYANRLRPGSFALHILDSREFLKNSAHADILILPPFRTGSAGSSFEPDERILDKMRREAAKGVIPASICAGAFYLCASGIPRDGMVATHWKLADELQRRFPAVKVRKEKTLIDEKRYISAGGITSFQDLSLYLIKKYVSLETALDIAGIFLINPEERNQLQYVKLNLEVAEDDDIVKQAQLFMHENLSLPLRMEDVASHCGTTVRTLLRRFKAAQADPPAEYLRHLRLSRARELLSVGRFPVKRIASECGYRDIVSFGRVFRQSSGLTPGDYRKRHSIL